MSLVSRGLTGDGFPVLSAGPAPRVVLRFASGGSGPRLDLTVARLLTASIPA
jgi:hypothetical protein